jgi:hypothetical protein
MSIDIAHPDSGGYGWDMDDSRKLEERMDAVTARALGAAAANWGRERQTTPTAGADPLRQEDGGLPAGWRQRLAQVKPADDAEMARAEAESWAEWRERKATIWAARLPDVYRAAVPRKDVTRSWLANYRAGRRHGLVILGDPGTGKTWEAMAIARALLTEDHVPVTVVTAPELMAALRPSADDVSDVGQFQVAPVLVLDDLGTEKLTDWVAEQLYLVASYRAARQLPTIVTSNLTPDEIKARYDQRLVQRLFGGAMLLTIAGSSLRPLPF